MFLGDITLVLVTTMRVEEEEVEEEEVLRYRQSRDSRQDLQPLRLE